MKILKLTFMLLLLVFLGACGSKELEQNPGSTPEEVIRNMPTNSEYEDEIVAALNKELKSGRKMDKIFLGYKFGMSPEEVKEHSQKLVRENKLKQKRESYYYNFIFDDDTAEAEVGFQYLADNSELMVLSIDLHTPFYKKPYFNKVLKLYVRKYILEKDEQNRPLYYKTETITKDINSGKEECLETYMFVTGADFISITKYSESNTTITYADNNRLKRNEEMKKEMSRIETDNSKRDENLEDI